MEQSLKVPVIRTADYIISLQLLKINDLNFTFAHCDVVNWSKNVAINLRNDWNTLFDLYNGDLFALNEQDDEKHRKFLAMYGFEFLIEAQGDDGIARNIFIRKQGRQ